MGMKSAQPKVRLGVVTGGRREGSAAKNAKSPSTAEPVLVAGGALPVQASEPAATGHAGVTSHSGVTSVAKDYFVERNGVKFAGIHLLVELWQATNLDNVAIAEQALRDSAAAAGATLLHVHLHHFSPNGGLSGVVVLAESHISIHTWPERGYAALDIFMCGACDPYKAIPVLRRAFLPGNVQLSEQKRGVIA